MDEIQGTLVTYMVVVITILLMITMVMTISINEYLSKMANNCITVEGKVYCERGE